MSNKAKAIRTEVRKRAPRRRTGLVIAGALVVFLTFVVKEEIRDELKDLRDSLAAAESLYTIEQDIRIVELHTFTLEEQASTIEIRQRSAAGDPATLRYPREIKTTIANDERTRRLAEARLRASVWACGQGKQQGPPQKPPCENG
jgi:hypothetical protein